jgi:hypothetical protein
LKRFSGACTSRHHQSPKDGLVRISLRSLFRKKAPAADVADRKRIFQERSAQEEAAMTPVREAAQAYNQSLSRRLPKEIWIDKKELRVQLGIRRHDQKYDVYEEVVWINYDLGRAEYKLSYFKGMKGEDKDMQILYFATAGDVIARMKEICESYFAAHHSGG